MSEQQDAEDRTSPKSAVVYEAIRREGEEELDRPSPALAWSGLAGGLSMGFSFLGVALFNAFLPHGTWTPLVSSFGYSLGFLIVILGRQQLYTENTLTVIVPLLSRRPRAGRHVVRVWAIALAANVVGALVFAYVVARTQVVDAHTYEALRDSAREAIAPSFGVALVRAIFAGWLIALIVWLLPFAESARIWVIIFLTYIVGLAHFPHVIVGTAEAGFRVFVGDGTWSEFLILSFLPALIGNSLGGAALVAALNHAQVKAGRRAASSS